MKKIFSIACFVGFCSSLLQAQNAVLSSGTWHKLSIEKAGVYKIDYSFLQTLGINPSSIDPRKIKIYTYPPGMLPQPNSIPRPDDLQEIALQIAGEQDGVFNTADYVLFFAEGADAVQWDVSKKIFRYENHLYEDFNYYYLTIGATNGKRILVENSLPGTHPVITEFDDYIFHELESYNELQSGRTWYGERFETTTEYTFPHDVPGLLISKPVQLVSDVMAQSFIAPSFTVSVNNAVVAQQAIGSIPNTKYGIKGLHNTDTLTFTTNLSRLDVRYKYNKASSGKSIGFLNFFLLNFKRTLSLYGSSTRFSSDESLVNAISTFRLSQVSSSAMIWDVTDPLNPIQQQTTSEGNTLNFSTETATLKSFIVFSVEAPAPVYVASVANQNLHGVAVPDLIIITPTSLKPEAARLASHRQAQSISVLVATPEEIYNEFSGGKQDVTALRDFIRYTWQRNPSKLKSVLLFGKGSYDYKNRVGNNTNLVPTYESRNSLEPLLSYSSDDYFTFLESNEGSWSESPVQNHTNDLGIGRLPVKNLAEAKIVVNKLIAYDSDASRFGKWKKEIVFFADDGNNDDGFSNTHHQQARDLADYLDTEFPQVTTKRFFMGAYPKVSRASGDLSPDLDREFANAFNEGSLIINYTGHGAEKILADEKIFNENAITSLNNKFYPLLVTATCAFGRNDDPALISGAELCLIQAQGGAIGLVTSARDVFSSTNFDLNQAFYEALLQKNNNEYLTIGEIFRRTKNNSINGVFNRNFSLLGDPSMTLAFPKLTIAVKSIETENGSDTVKALSKVLVTGEIRDNQNELVSFDGLVLMDVFDKKTPFRTLGERNSPITFQQWSNSLFRGSATVSNGLFSFEFVVPKNINYQLASGRIAFYAISETEDTDGWGTSEEWVIGGSETNAAADTSPPEIRLFLGDTTFVNGGIVSPATRVIGLLSDESGINISGYGIGNSLQVVVDERDVFIVNDYYQSNTDTYQSGLVDFLLPELAPGRHLLRLKAWDTYNNPADARVDFTVTDSESIQVEASGFYPNPTQNEATFFFTHNRAGDLLAGRLTIYNSMGQQTLQEEFESANSQYQVEVLKLNSEYSNSKKLQKGVYFVRLEVRSLSNGSKTEQLSKLIVTN